MAVVTTAGTPLGTGLIRYVAIGGEPIRDAAHYTGLTAPTVAYTAGQTIEVLLDAGYSQLSSTTKDHLLGAYRAPNAYAVQSDQGDNKTHHLQLQFVTDEAINSDLAAFEALQDAGMQGSVLFWYPDYTNYPSEYIPCVIRNRHNPARNGVFFTVDLELSAISSVATPPTAFA